MDEAGVNEPVVHEPRAEPSAERAAEPGGVQGRYEPAPEQDAEPEIG